MNHKPNKLRHKYIDYMTLKSYENVFCFKVNIIVTLYDYVLLWRLRHIHYSMDQELFNGTTIEN